MYQIVYISKATRKFSEEDLLQLCERSAVNNKERGVTGLLLYDGARFIQALEGDEAAVRQTMSRIARNTGHTDIDFYSERATIDREFGDWSMDRKQANIGCCSREFLDKVKHDVSTVEDLDLRAAFIGFAVLSSTQSDPGYRCKA